MKRKNFITLLVIIALLLGVFTVAQAATSTKTLGASYSRLIGGGVQKLKFNAKYEYGPGTGARAKSKWYTQNTSGGYHYHNNGMGCYPSGWTSGRVECGMYYALHSPSHSAIKTGYCHSQVDNVNGVLKTISKGCR